MDLQPAIDLIKKFEGCALTAYPDPGGIWTIGYGHTSGVKDGDSITLDFAEQLLARDLGEHAAQVLNCVTAEITDNQFCALISFCFNVGIGKLSGSTLLSKLNDGKPHEEVADEFLRWIYQDHKLLHGLAKRRIAERDLFLKS